MMHKRLVPLSFLIGFFFTLFAHAERRSVMVIDSSSSGRLVRINIGSMANLRPGEPILFSVARKKVAAGRVYRVDEGSAIVAVLEKYGSESPTSDLDYEVVYGEYFEGADNLPNYVANRDEEIDNPANERFFEKNRDISTPELDDEDYSPEITLRPKLPQGKMFHPHNISVGLQLFRNRALPTSDIPDSRATGYSTYQGYTFRYAYTFRTHYWMRIKTPALISAEATFGIYNFDHTFNESTVSQVRVTPLGFNLRYLIEVSRMFFLYPYVGYQYNIVGAVDGNLTNLENLRGGRLLGGGGAQLVMSESVDARVEGGSDGILGAVVVKF